MLDMHQRADRYAKQTGRSNATPRQLRRIAHKFGHQSPEAAEKRQAKSAERSRVRAARKARLAGLLGR